MLKTTEVARLAKLSQTAFLTSLIALGCLSTPAALAKKSAPKAKAKDSKLVPGTDAYNAYHAVRDGSKALLFNQPKRAMAELNEALRLKPDYALAYADRAKHRDQREGEDNCRISPAVRRKPRTVAAQECANGFDRCHDLCSVTGRAGWARGPDM